MIDAAETGIRAWRKAERTRLLAEREAMPDTVRRHACAAIEAAFWGRFGGTELGLVAGYWPIRGEVDVRPILRRILDCGGSAALPVAVGQRQPLEFHPWTPDTPLKGGRWDIRHPAAGPAVRPDLLLIPLVGFDADGGRLGYGGGYYDRTLAAFGAERPLAVGLGFELGRLPSIRPGPHDARLDLVITEAGVVYEAI